VQRIGRRLAEPFQADEVKWKPQVVKGDRAMAIAYIDARVVQDRLDQVLGFENWEDEYHSLDQGSVMCKLRVRIGSDWIEKVDVGSPSEQPDEGDRVKAAFSDALKRAAVKFGLGRYLYRLPSQWCDYDPVKKQFKRLPGLPDWAKPTVAIGGNVPGVQTGADLVQKIERFTNLIREAVSVDQLAKVWSDIVANGCGQNKNLATAKDAKKASLTHVENKHPAQGKNVQSHVPGSVPAA
jgi:hypothetical protein